MDTTDRRDGKALALFARCSEWQQGRKSDGRPFFYIPGNTEGAVYMTDATSCTCPAAQHYSGLCKRSLAVAEYLDRRAPKSDVAILEQLKADQTAHARTLRLTGWTPDELLEHPVYTQRAGQIARLEARATVAA